MFKKDSINKSQFVSSRIELSFSPYFFLLIYLLIGTNNVIGQSINDYILIAKKNSLELKEKNYDVELATEKINEVGIYQKTNIDIGFFATQPQTPVGSFLFNVGVSQELPWIGELRAEKKLKEKKAALKQFDISLSEKELVYQVKELYYTLYEKQAIQEVLRENKHLLKTYEEMATYAMGNNLSTMNEVLNISIQKNELHSKTFQIYNEIETLRKNFNRILEQNINTTLNIPTTLDVLDILIGDAVVHSHPLLENTKYLEEVYNAEFSIINLANKPDIAIGVDYFLINKQDNIAINDNEKDIWMPKISLKFSVSNQKKKSQQQQIKIKKDQLFYKIEKQKRQLESAMDLAALNFHNALVRVVSAQKNREETQRIINLHLKAYETNPLKYDKILKLQLKKIHYQLMEIEATKSAYIAKSKVEYLSE